MDMADPHIHRYAIIWHMLPWYMGYFSFLYLVCFLSISPFPGLAVPELTYAPTKATGKFHHKWMISGGFLRRIRVLFWFLFDVWVRVLCPAEWSWCFFSQLWCSIIHMKIPCSTILLVLLVHHFFLEKGLIILGWISDLSSLPSLRWSTRICSKQAKGKTFVRNTNKIGKDRNVAILSDPMLAPSIFIEIS